MVKVRSTPLVMDWPLKRNVDLVAQCSHYVDSKTDVCWDLRLFEVNWPIALYKYLFMFTKSATSYYNYKFSIFELVLVRLKRIYLLGILIYSYYSHYVLHNVLHYIIHLSLLCSFKTNSISFIQYIFENVDK